MKKFLIILVLLVSVSATVFSAQPKPTRVVKASQSQKGGCMPAALSCCLGPRIGLEYNEGIPVEGTEWLRLIYIGALINDYQAFQKNGCVGCLLEGFLGPRVGREYDKRNVRTLEWIGLITADIPNLIMAFEAYGGKTMTEIDRQEHLSK